jgi:hypothetical protein
MPRQKLWFNRSMGEKIMKITIAGVILIVAAVLAALVVLNISASATDNPQPGSDPFTPHE